MLCGNAVYCLLDDLGFPFQPHVHSVQEPTWAPAHVVGHDLDPLGHVNNAVWVTWIQDMATSHWEAVADPAHVAAYVWVVTRHEIDYRGNVKAGEPVTGRTWVDGTPRGARFDRRVDFLDDPLEYNGTGMELFLGFLIIFAAVLLVLVALVLSC